MTVAASASAVAQRIWSRSTMSMLARPRWATFRATSDWRRRQVEANRRTRKKGDENPKRLDGRWLTRIRPKRRESSNESERFPPSPPFDSVATRPRSWQASGRVECPELEQGESRRITTHMIVGTEQATSGPSFSCKRQFADVRFLSGLLRSEPDVPQRQLTPRNAEGSLARKIARRGPAGFGRQFDAAVFYREGVATLQVRSSPAPGDRKRAVRQSEIVNRRVDV